MNFTAYNLSNGVTVVQINGLVSTPVAGAVTQQPVHFIACLDQSGSMHDANKLRNVVTSLKFLLDHMREQDAFSLITFETTAIKVFTCLPTNRENKVLIRQRLSGLRPLHATNISAAIATVHEIMASVSNLSAYKHGVLLLTDGEATAGATTDAELQTFTTTLLNAYPQLTFTTIGYGDSHNAALLAAMAQRGGGSYNIVQNVEQVASVFGNVLGGLATCVAQQVRITAPPPSRQLTTFAERTGDPPVTIFVGDVLEGGENMVVLEGVPAGATLTLQGSSMRDGTPIRMETGTAAEGSATQQADGMSAYLRCKTVQLMSDSLQFVMRAPNSDEMNRMMERCSLLRTEVETLPAGPLVDMLVGEIVRCRDILTSPLSPPRMARHVSNTISQHTAYLGTARGIHSTDGSEVAPSVFATTNQRELSTEMYQHVSTPMPPAYNSNSSSAGTSNPTITTSLPPDFHDDEDPPSPPVLRRS
jgi:von Willebrand factor type A domain